MKSEVAEDAIGERLSQVEWRRVEADLDAYGSAVLEHLLAPEECDAIAAMYPDDAAFRSRVVMTRHGFGRGNISTFAIHCPTWWSS
ncbi:MAG: uncharacterized protein QOJ42_7263 [Acidobacteriaceae bacterium]|jgi:hypothetical protein|nr:proline hydroxylase [Gammaproteobacteria bacterium]MDT7817347.1 uncharacterized protein [Acidobacteriaceae bacterium]